MSEKSSFLPAGSKVAVALLPFLAASWVPSQLQAEEIASYTVNASMNDNLKTFVGKSVYVTLNSGKSLAGYVKEVGPHLLHLEKLSGKEYFDALIRIDDISAIDTRFRK